MSHSDRETSFRDHEADAQSGPQLGFAVVTFSDTRTEETDRSGAAIRELIESAGHRVSVYAIVPDDPAGIAVLLREILDDPDVAVVVTNGSTGISHRDSAYEVVSRLLDKRLDGFGELFRMLSYQEIGAAAMLSRAVGGIAGGKVLFSLPGSTNAVKLGMTQLILPQAAHLARELRKHDREGR